MINISIASYFSKGFQSYEDSVRNMLVSPQQILCPQMLCPSKWMADQLNSRSKLEYEMFVSQLWDSVYRGIGLFMIEIGMI